MSNIYFLSPLHILRDNILPQVILCVYKTIQPFPFQHSFFLLYLNSYFQFSHKNMKTKSLVTII